ncbi:hypothetical protein NC651_036364 [Populus alba x Populus x berolinensis]|nr:hypothetical protein NC651_036364 [Populus alba x Populus x berolinensis]
MGCSSKHDVESAKFGELTLLAELEFKKSSSDHLEEPVAFSDKPLEKTRQEDKKIKRERIGKRRKGQLRKDEWSFLEDEEEIKTAIIRSQVQSS